MSQLADTGKERGREAIISPSSPPVLAILVPVLGRPHRVEPLLQSIAAVTTSKYNVYFIHNRDDFEEIAAIQRSAAWKNAIVCDGNYAEKINLAASITREPLIFTGADDLHFHPGWLEAAMAKLGNGIQVVGTNDLCNQKVMQGTHATHSLVTREYLMQGTIDEPGKLLHEGYEHEWVDNEFVETAQVRGAFATAPDSVVEHLHPMVGKAPMDDLYADSERRMRTGQVLFEQRKALWC